MEVYYFSIANFNMLEIHSINEMVLIASSRHQ